VELALPEQTKYGELLLDPMDRVSEVLFGLIMVLSATCSFSIGGAGATDARQMLIGALGCGLAWGLIDAAMFLMSCFATRATAISALRRLRGDEPLADARRVITDAMPETLAKVLPPEELDSIRQRLNQLPAPPSRPRLTRRDLLASGRVFLLVFSATWPALVPFVFVSDPKRALRISNATVIAMLFLTGYLFGKYADYYPLRMGLVMVAIGCAMVALTIALGG
jgi:hypothetical protein